MPRLTTFFLTPSRIALALLVAVAMALAACDTDYPGSSVSDAGGPAPDVNLPPVPQLQTERPMSYPDGSISIWALGLQRQQLMGTDVQVTGYVKQMYICPFRAQQEASDTLIEYNLYLSEDEREELLEVAMGTGEVPLGLGTGEGSGMRRCNYPHLFIADAMTSEQQILVTGYGVPMEAQLLVGERYLFEGRFMEETRGFNAAGQGLIYVTRISGGNLVEPPVPGQDDGIEVQ